MTPQASLPRPVPSRLHAGGEWLLVLGLAAAQAWTTLCLGGYLAETMVTTAWAVFGLAALAGLLWLLGTGGEPPRLNLAALLPLPFLAYSLASVIWIAPARWLAWREWLLWVQMWLVFVLVLHFGRSRRQTGVFVGTFVALGLTGVIMAAYQRYVDQNWLMLGWVHGWSQAGQFIGRSAGMFGVPNSLGALLELMIPVCLTLLFARSTGIAVKVVCGWLAALFAFAVVLTGSRGTYISLALALMLWPLLAGREWRRRIAGVLAVFALVAAGVWGLYRFSEPAHVRIQPFLEGRFELSRPIIWKVGLQIWRDHPWLGSGARSYNLLFDQYRPRGFLNDPDWAHNDYLNTLSDYGVAGFLLWAVAGGGLLWLGWRAVQRARQEIPPAGDHFEGYPWRLGLFVGLAAFVIHLAVDFHTKVPALAFGFSFGLALLLRNEPGLFRPFRLRWAGFGLATMASLLAWNVAEPLYRADALRYPLRRAIDKQAATGKGDLNAIIPAAKAGFQRAVQVYPADAQAWADLAYATVQDWRVAGGDLATIGRQAEAEAEKALKLCPVDAEFWVRKGVALDMQARQKEAEPCFRRAVELAPNTPPWWYYYAYHLQTLPGRKPDALRALETCLALDPSNSGAISLRQQLAGQR